MYRRSLLLGLSMVLVFAAFAPAANHPPEITNLRVEQRADEYRFIDVYYDIADQDGDSCAVYLRASPNGGESWRLCTASTTGDVTSTTQPGHEVQPGAGKHIVWDMGTDVPGGLYGPNLRARLIADDGKSTDPRLAFVPAGWFTTSTGVRVYLHDYWIGKYEVTNEEWCLFLNLTANGEQYHRQDEIEDLGGFYVVRAGLENRPVGYVSWNDARAYCAWLGNDYHLPTDAQWEKAAAWASEQEKLWKYGFQSDSIDSSKCNYGNNVGHSTDVGSYHPHRSFYGCYDMSGNVREWCQDLYGGAYPSGTTNPIGPSGGSSSRILRGGSWHGSSTYCESGYRYGNNPARVNYYVGFRVSRTIE